MDRCLPTGLKTVPGTVTFHQIVATVPQRISCRKLSCFCCDAAGDGKSCECYNPVAVTFPEPTSSPEQVVSQPAERVTMSGDILTPVHVYSEDLQVKWCAVTYDVGSGGITVRAPACRSRGRWFDSTSAVSKLGQFRSPHFARVFRKRH